MFANERLQWNCAVIARSYIRSYISSYIYSQQ